MFIRVGRVIVLVSEMDISYEMMRIRSHSLRTLLRGCYRERNMLVVYLLKAENTYKLYEQARAHREWKDTKRAAGKTW
jgi:hypothetical protein